MGKTALVTGACGFVGSHVVEHLTEHEWDIVATDLEANRRTDFYDESGTSDHPQGPHHRYYGDLLEDLGVQFVSADLTRRSTLEPLFDHAYDVVFHTASLYDYFADWEALYEVNVEGGRNIGELAATNDVGHFVHWSTLGVCAGSEIETNEPVDETAPYDPHNRYGRSKAEQERALFALAEENELPLTVLRPAPVYGPRHTYGVYHLLYLYRKVGTGLIFPIYPRDRQLRFPSVHVEDLVRAAVFVYANADETVGEIYHVTSDPISQDNLVAFVVESLGLPRRQIPLPWPVYRTIARWLVTAAEFYERRARDRDITPKFPASMAQYLANDFRFSNEKLKSAGFEFVYADPRRGLWEYITWCKERGLL